MQRLGMQIFCSQVCVFLASLMAPTVHAAPGCPAGWFGAGCRLRCNCEQSQDCGVGGQCPNNGECKSPYFGRGCQYVDVLLTHASANTPIFVRDRNHSTCNPNPTDRSLQVSLVDPQPSLWFTVYASNNITLFPRNFTVKVDQQTDTQVKMFKILHTNALEVRIYNHSTTMTKLTIEGPAVPYICTINVSKGRNVALHQRVRQSSNFDWNGVVKIVIAENAVDGSTDGDFKKDSCSHTMFEETTKKAYWEVTFDRPYCLHMVLVYNRNEHMKRLSGFTLSLYNETGGLQYQHVDNLIAPLPMYTVAPPQAYTAKVLKIESGHSPFSVLTLCEVEVYGESTCPRNMYGFDCEHQCDCDESVQCSVSAGTCQHVPDYYCPPGKHGKLCKLSCSEHCQNNLCDARSGNCFHCVPGYIGELCDKDCQEGWFGENCSRFCPRICPYRKCDNITGQCSSCVGRRTGPKCEDCSPHYYGPLCDIPCTVYCLNRSCNKINGYCYSCVEGFYGEYCNREKESVFPPFLLLPLLIPFVVMVVCCFFVGGGDIHSEED